MWQSDHVSQRDSSLKLSISKILTVDGEGSDVFR